MDDDPLPEPAPAEPPDGDFLPVRDVLGYDLPVYPFVRPPELETGEPGHYPVVVVGGGLVGLTVTCDLALRGVPVLLLDEDTTSGARGLSSRGVNYARRSLEIFDRLGVAGRILARGNVWTTHRTYHGADTVAAYGMDWPETEKHPPVVAVQQYHVEGDLIDRIAAIGGADLRWGSRVSGIVSHRRDTRLTVETPEGAYAITADWVLACDGARSTLRRLMGLDNPAEPFEDHWFIADVKMDADIPHERHFWIDPPFHPGRCALLLEMSDGLWRSDMELGAAPDVDTETTAAAARARVERMLGGRYPFRLVWAGLYSFKRRLMDRFRHGNVLFLGDAAHENPPLGGRGGNGGIQDADNLGWKLAAVLAGAAPEALLDSYHAERRPAAEENIAEASKSVRFCAPDSESRRLYRDAVLALARDHGFARAMVNTGRMSVPFAYAGSALVTPDGEGNEADSGGFAGGPAPGAAAINARLGAGSGGGWLFDRLGPGFTLLTFGGAPALPDPPLPDPPPGLEAVGLDAAGLDAVGFETVVLDAVPPGYDGAPGTCYLLRPDRHVAGRWRRADGAAIAAALFRSLGRSPDLTAGRSPGLAAAAAAATEDRRGGTT